MQMNQIRYFLALYDERNFTRAAKRCGVSQPSLTNAIKRLEQILGGPLFDRASRNTEPTVTFRSGVSNVRVDAQVVEGQDVVKDLKQEDKSFFQNQIIVQ